MAFKGYVYPVFYKPSSGGSPQSATANFVERTPTVYQAAGSPGTVTAVANFVSRTPTVYQATGAPGAVTAVANLVSRTATVYQAAGAQSAAANFVSRTATVYQAAGHESGVVGPGLVAEFVGHLAKTGTLPGNNTDPTSTWDDIFDGNDGTLGTFDWDDVDSGWDGDGSIADPYRLLMKGDGSDNVKVSGVSVVKYAGTKGYTFEAWLLVPDRAPTTTQCAICQRDAVGGTYQVGWLGFAVNNEARFYYRPSGGTSHWAIAPVTFGTGLHHIVGTFQTGSNGMKVYIDGSNSGATNATEDAAHTTTATDADLSVGGMLAPPSTWSYPYPEPSTFVGAVATVRIYERPLTADEVAKNYWSGINAISGWKGARANFVSRTPTVHQAAGAPGSVTAVANFVSRTATVYEGSGAPGTVTAVAEYVSRAATVYQATGAPGSVTAVASYVSRTADKTFGNESTATCDRARNADRQTAMCKTTLVERTFVTSLHLYLKGTAGNSQVITACVWAADGTDGAPGTLKGTSEEVTIANDPSTAWRTFNFSAPVSLPAGDYWLGALFGDNSAVVSTFRVAAPAGSYYYLTRTYEDGPADPFGSGTGEAFAYGGIYATCVSAPIAPPATGAPGSVTAVAELVSRAATIYQASGSPGSFTAVANYVSRSATVYQASGQETGVTGVAEFVSRSASVFNATGAPGSVTAIANYVSRSATVYAATGAAQTVAAANFVSRSATVYQASGVMLASAEIVTRSATVYQATGAPGSTSAQANLVSRTATVYQATGTQSGVFGVAQYVERTPAVYSATGVPGATSAVANFVSRSATVYTATGEETGVTAVANFVDRDAAVYEATGQPGSASATAQFVSRSASVHTATGVAHTTAVALCVTRTAEAYTPTGVPGGAQATAQAVLRAPSVHTATGAPGSVTGVAQYVERTAGAYEATGVRTATAEFASRTATVYTASGLVEGTTTANALFVSRLATVYSATGIGLDVRYVVGRARGNWSAAVQDSEWVASNESDWIVGRADTT